MGCGSSRAAKVADLSALINPSELFDDFIEEQTEAGFVLPADKIAALKTVLLAKLPSDKGAALDTLGKTLDYLNGLAKRRRGKDFLAIAIAIIINAQQVWHLNERSLTFFHELNGKAPEGFNRLCAYIGRLCLENTLFLQADHINTVIDALARRIELPDSAMDALDAYLERTNPDINRIMQRLRVAQGPELTRTASMRALIHHDVPHALEIKKRTMYIVCEKLGLLKTSGDEISERIRKRNEFLQAIAGFMVEFHDFIQGDKGEYKSVELATAAKILEWLTLSLALTDYPEIRKIMEFMVDQIVVLGTTMVFSKTRTMDLSELYLIVKDEALAADHISALPSAAFANLMETIMLVTGVCDKNPAAFLAIANLQWGDEHTATLPIVKRYSSNSTTPLLLEQFFGGRDFTPYFPDSSPALNQQRFLIALVPHLSMRAELMRGKPEVPRKYIDFVNLCRQRKQELRDNDSEFKRWYNAEFAARSMEPIIQELFFDAIDGEVAFSHSQTGGLEFVSARLRGLLPESAAAGEPLLDPTIPAKDAANIAALGRFYNGLNRDEKSSLINELLLVVIMQAGNLYAELPADSYRRVPTAAAPLMARILTDDIDVTAAGPIVAGPASHSSGYSPRFLWTLPGVPKPGDAIPTHLEGEAAAPTAGLAAAIT